MFIALLLEAYSEIKSSSGADETLWQQGLRFAKGKRGESFWKQICRLGRTMTDQTWVSDAVLIHRLREWKKTGMRDKELDERCLRRCLGIGKEQAQTILHDTMAYEGMVLKLEVCSMLSSIRLVNLVKASFKRIEERLKDLK